MARIMEPMDDTGWLYEGNVGSYEGRYAGYGGNYTDTAMVLAS